MEFHSTIEKIRKLQQPNSEESTKLQAILPILRCLGWNSEDPNKLEAEYSVGGGKKADYVLFGPEKKHLALVEAKRADFLIDNPKSVVFEDGFRQVVEYAFVHAVSICIFTTGFKWLLLYPLKEGTTPEQRIFAKMDIKTDPLDELIDKFETYLSYDALKSGNAVTHAKNALDEQLKREKLATELPRIWNIVLKEPPKELIELIKQRIESENLPPYDEQVKRFLGEQARNISEPFPLSAPTHPQLTNSIPQRKNITRSAQPSAYRLWSEQYSVKFWKDILKGVARALYLRHANEFGWKVKDPYKPKTYISDDKSEMKSPHRIEGSPYWIDTHASAVDIQKRCKNLLKLFGHSERDLQIEYD